MNNFSSVGNILFSIFILVSTLGAVELDWEHNYNRALVKAKKEKKMVYLFIGADKCRYCERFKKLTLSKEDVIKDMKKDYVLLYMSRDQHKIPNKFEKYGAPRHYFLTPEGEVIAEAQGSREVDGWYNILDEVDLIKDDLNSESKEKLKDNR